MIHQQNRCTCECPHYTIRPEFGFNFHKYNTGTKITFGANEVNRVIFVRAGSVNITSEHLGTLNVCSFQMANMYIGYQYTMEVADNVDMVIICFQGAVQLCQTISLEHIKVYIDDLPYCMTCLPIKEPLDKMLDSLSFFFDNNIHCEYLHYAKQIELFLILRLCYTNEELTNFFYHILSKNALFQSIIQRNCANAKTVEELARICGYSLSTFKRLFKENFNEPPYQWMRKQMAEGIKMRLMDFTIPLKAIISEFGFTDHSHFSTYCKRYLGATPKQIRERVK